MENVIVASSNVFGILPVITCFKHVDFLTGSVIGLTVGASTISHLVECHKHCMNGIGYSREVSSYWNRLDVFFAHASAIRIGYLMFKKGNKIPSYILIMLLGSLGLNLISEYDKYNCDIKTRYIILHSLWHISIFNIINGILKNIYT